MEMTEINILSDFEAGTKCLQNPSLFSRFSPLSNIGKLPQVDSFWKWCALILAIFASFTTVINRIMLLIYRLRIKSLISSAQTPSQQLDYGDFDFSDDETSLSETESDDDEEFESTSSSEDKKNKVNEVFRAAGSSSSWEGGCCNLKIRRPNLFSLSDFSAGKSVVQLWESFGLGLDFEEDSNESEIAIWDLDGDTKISSSKQCQVPALTVSSTAGILLAEMNGINGDVLGAYDPRVCHKIPAINAAWWPRQRKALIFNSGGVEKAYVIDTVAASALTISDTRNIKTPLKNLTKLDGDTWRDAESDYDTM